MNCEYCNKVFSSISALNLHKKTAKYCLKKRNDSSAIMKHICSFCEKEFNRLNSLQSHLEICSIKKERDYENEIHILKKQYEDEIQKLKQKYESEIIFLQNLVSQQTMLIGEKNGLLEKLKEENIKLSAYSEKSDEHYKDSQELLSKSKIINNTINNNTNTNNININCVLEDINQIKQIIFEHLNANYVIEGQEGIANFALDYLLKNVDGELSYICTDPSRKTFRYKNNDGIVRDMRAVKLTGNLCEADLKQKAHDIAQKYWTDDNGEIIATKYQLMSKKMLEINNIDSDNSKFSSRLSSLTS